MLEDRLALNNRFVVPVDVPADGTTTFHDIQGALSTSGLSTGNVIEIKQGANPGPISSLPSVTNLTIRSEAGVGAKDLATINVLSDLTVSSAGLSLVNLNLAFSGKLTFTARGYIAGNVIKLDGEIELATTAGVEISQNDIAVGESYGIRVTTVANGKNLIAGNTFTSFKTSFNSINYTTASGTTADVIRDNTFVGTTGINSYAIVVTGGVNGLTILRNLFRDSDDAVGAIYVGDSQIIALQNTIDFPGFTSGFFGAIHLDHSSGSYPSGVIAGNIVNAGTGTAIVIGRHTSTSYPILIEGNDILAAQIGVRLEASNGGSLSPIDLGGGSLGGRGGNNFRFFRSSANSTSGAIVVTSDVVTANLQARNNLFSSIGAETSVYDSNDTAARVTNVITSNNLTGNGAFVQALYVRFLRRARDTSDPNDGEGFVTFLNNGGSPLDVANAVVRSPEAVGYTVDDLYRTIMNRDADPAGRAYFVNQLVSGVTLEAVKASFYASPEYRLRFASDRAFVASLYAKELNRVTSDSEYQPWINAVAVSGRTAVAQAILSSNEAHSRSTARMYVSILKRNANPSEVAAWASTGFDEISIRIYIASSPEGQSII